ncbi:MAG: ROK family protein [Mariprofundaceae bacterium]|nr:ROK family protein [Mariprofundaceae bacterium]
MNTPLALGMDVGGTNIRLALIDQSGCIVKQARTAAELSKCAESEPAAAGAFVLDILTQAMRPLLDAHHGNIQAVGIGFPGFFDSHTKTLISSPNIPGLSHFPLGTLLAGQLGLPVSVQNDASLAALGESRFGAGKGLLSLLHLTLGTGIGGGAIIDGRLYGGDGGMAMEIGHLRVAPEDRQCGCGASGCMETWASATAVGERFSALSGKTTGAREVGRLADTGDAQAQGILHDAGMVLGRGIAEAVKLLDIRHVSISGGLTGAWPHLAPALEAELNARLIPPLVGKIKILRSRLADDAGILGAAALAFDMSKAG